MCKVKEYLLKLQEKKDVLTKFSCTIQHKYIILQCDIKVIKMTHHTFFGKPLKIYSYENNEINYADFDYAGRRKVIRTNIFSHDD